MAKKPKSVKLHPEHGLNPILVLCRWCGRPTGEIALLGAAYDGETPTRGAINDEPCEECKGFMAQGVTFIERTRDGERTGRWIVLKDDAVKRLLDEPLLSQVLKRRAANILPEVAEFIGLFTLPKDGGNA